jgi:Uma2 family endonuclease
MILENTDAFSTYEKERGKPPPTLLHSMAQSNLTHELVRKYDEQYDILPEIDIVLNDWKICPDIAIYPLQNTDNQRDILFMTNPPLVAIEILSYPVVLDDLIKNANQYFENNTKSYWLVIPILQNIYVYEQPYNYTIFRKTEILKDNNLGIEMDLTKIFK